MSYGTITQPPTLVAEHSLKLWSGLTRPLSRPLYSAIAFDHDGFFSPLSCIVNPSRGFEWSAILYSTLIPLAELLKAQQHFGAADVSQLIGILASDSRPRRNQREPLAHALLAPELIRHESLIAALHQEFPGLDFVAILGCQLPDGDVLQHTWLDGDPVFMLNAIDDIAQSLDLDF